MADRDWLIRWHEAGYLTVAIPDAVYTYGQHPGSLTFDAARQHDFAIRAELLELALRWRHNPSASAKTRRIAVVLEGRCRATLGFAAWRTGGDAAGIWWREDGQLSAAPLLTIARGGLDWVGQRLFAGREPKNR